MSGCESIFKWLERRKATYQPIRGFEHKVKPKRIEGFKKILKTIVDHCESVEGKKFLDTYIPIDDIGDRRRIRVDYGFGVGGYQGFLMHLQAKDAGTMSLRRAMEAMPGIH